MANNFIILCKKTTTMPKQKLPNKASNMQVNPFLKVLYESKYAILLVLFSVWIIFFDSNNLLSFIQLKKEISTLEDKKEHYVAEIVDMDRAYKNLTTNKQTIIDYARNQELVKGEDEDIFKIVPEKQKTSQQDHHPFR